MRVPVYQRRVSERAGPTVRDRTTDPTTRAEGQAARGLAELGRSINQLGGSIYRGGRGAVEIYEQVRAISDEAALNETKSKYGALKRGYLQQLEAMEGHNAIDGQDKLLESMRADVDKLRNGDGKDHKGIPNDRVKRQFDELLVDEMGKFEALVFQHVARESEKVSEKALSGALEVFRSDAAEFARVGDIGNANAAISEGIKALERDAVLRGRSGEELEAQKLRYVTASKLPVVDELLKQKRFDAAEAYLAEHSASMDANAIRQSQVRERIEQGKQEAIVGDWVKGILEFSEGDASKALGAVDSMMEGESDETKRNVSNEIVKIGHEQNRARIQKDGPIADAIGLDMQRAIDERRIHLWHPSRSEGWHDLDKGSQEKLLQVYNVQRRVQRGEWRANQAEARRKQVALRNAYLLDYIPGSDTSDLSMPDGMTLDTWRDTQRRAKAIDEMSIKGEANSVADARRMAMDFLPDMGIPYSKDKNSRYARIMGDVIAEWSEKKDPADRTNADLQALLKRSITKHMLDGEKIEWGAMTLEQKYRAIPDSHRRAIEDRYRRAGIGNVPRNLIVDTYERALDAGMR